MDSFSVDHGVVLLLPRQFHPAPLALALERHSVARVKFAVEGVGVKVTPFRAAQVVCQMDTDVRVLVRGGTAKLFPRPTVFVDDDGQVTVNGRPCGGDELDQWCAVWPSITKLRRIPGAHLADEMLPGSGELPCLF